MAKRRANRQPKKGQGNQNQKKKQPFNDMSGGRMHMNHNGIRQSPHMEELMRQAIERPNKNTLSIPVMEAIQRQMGNQFAVTLIQRASATDNSDYTGLRSQFDPNFKGSSGPMGEETEG